jgi:hypothetical protein
MKCFNHRELDAIAVCKHCGRALCAGCVVESSGMSACKGRCEAGVAAAHSETQLNLHSFVSLVTVLRVVALLGYTVGVAGIGVGILGLLLRIGARTEATEIAALGVVSLAIGLWLHHLARQFKLRAEKLS